MRGDWDRPAPTIATGPDNIPLRSAVRTMRAKALTTSPRPNTASDSVLRAVHKRIPQHDMTNPRRNTPTGGPEPAEVGILEIPHGSRQEGRQQ